MLVTPHQLRTRAAIGQLSLLEHLYEVIVIPQVVYNEMAELQKIVPGTIEVQTQEWIQVQPVNGISLLATLQTNLDAGEAAAIALALELKAELLIMDERPGRTVALFVWIFCDWNFGRSVGSESKKIDVRDGLFSFKRLLHPQLFN